MSGSASLELERQLLQHTLAIAPMPTLARVYVALCQTAPTEAAGGAELAGGGYARTAATFTLLATPANAAANATAVDFAPATGDWRPISHFELWTQATGGTRLYWGQLVDPADGTPVEIDVLTGSAVRFSPGSLVVQAAETTAAVGIGPFLPIAGGEMTGPLLYTTTGATIPRSAQDRAADIANALDFGADPTGATDSTAPINAALATHRTVYLPAGDYHVTNSLNLGTATIGQTFYGDGSATTLHIWPDLNPAALGIVVLAPVPWPLGLSIGHTVRDMRFVFHQPLDFVTTTTAASTAGAPTITVADASGVFVGAAVHDQTVPACLNNVLPGLANALVQTTVVSKAGNVITLSVPVRAGNTVAIGHSITFGTTRAQFQTLAAHGPGPLVAGGPGIKYPWAIYAPAASPTPYQPHNTFIDNVQIGQAWRGVYLRGSTQFIGRLEVAAFDVALDIDENFNFSSIDYFQFYPGFGKQESGGECLDAVFYDGQAIATNIRAGLTANTIATFSGIVNIQNAGPGLSIAHLQLDGNNSNLNVTAGFGAIGIANCYSTKGLWTHGVPIAVDASGTEVQIGNLSLTTAGAASAVTVANGTLAAQNVLGWNGLQGNVPFVAVSGGVFSLTNGRMTGPGTSPFIAQTGGSIRVRHVSFDTDAVGAGRVGIAVTDAASNDVRDVHWNGWTMTGIPAVPLGSYEPEGNAVIASSYKIGANNLAAPVQLKLASAAGQTREVLFQTNGNTRWSIRAALTAESGGDTGSDFRLDRYGDAGFAGSPIQIARSNGAMTLTGPLGFQGATPIAKPTISGSRGGNAALASLLTALASYGLITDSSTA